MSATSLEQPTWRWQKVASKRGYFLLKCPACSKTGPVSLTRLSKIKDNPALGFFASCSGCQTAVFLPDALIRPELLEVATEVTRSPLTYDTEAVEETTAPSIRSKLRAFLLAGGIFTLTCEVLLALSHRCGDLVSIGYRLTWLPAFGFVAATLLARLRVEKFIASIQPEPHQ